MSDWKNPSFDNKQWHTPAFLDDDNIETDDADHIVMMIALGIKVTAGAAVLLLFNALLFFGAFRIIGNNLGFFRCIGLAGIYVLFRAYDKVTLGKQR